MKPQTSPHTRAWVNRCLEVTTTGLKELQIMREETEKKVREVLEEQRSPKKRESRSKNLDMDQRRRSAEDEVLIRVRRCHLETFQEITPSENSDLIHDLVEVSQVKIPPRKPTQWSVASPRTSKTFKEPSQESSMDHPQTASRQNQAPSDRVTGHRPSTWSRTEGQGLDKANYNLEQSEDRLPLSVFPTETASLRRIGSGSSGPRLRLGSSGVTSDLFTKRMNGNCLSAHSSGFYDTSDLDSTSSSRSSLCSDISCHTSVSLMSPHRSSGMRPRSIDCSLERKRELQNGMAQTKRPMSAGALDGYLRSASISRFDLSQSFDATSCDYPYAGTPPLCAIQQRQKAERYIYKLALKYRCKPGGSTIRPDLGPPTPRRPAQAFPPSGSHVSCPSSPQVTSLSSSLVDVRKHSTGSWGRFLSRVMLKKDSRIAASEINLERCGQGSRDTLQCPTLSDGPFTRTKSFRDLLTVKSFKRSQKGLNKVW
ncbi:uncharacterized protein RB166_014679 [Leptodactylus fuscus]|uniref:uncharacterized protein LOC142214442 n=1 Tax=Leptodactylus fuscus TaxID=238119 RepID=UPI003F4E7AA6